MRLIYMLLLLGCAHTLTENQEYDRQSKIDQTRDLIIGLVEECTASGGVLVYRGPVQGNPVRRANARRLGSMYISKHAHPSEYRCE